MVFEAANIGLDFIQSICLDWFININKIKILFMYLFKILITIDENFIFLVKCNVYGLKGHQLEIQSVSKTISTLGHML